MSGIPVRCTLPVRRVNKHHVETYGPLTKFAYKDFIPMFKAEHYDPQAWARLFKQAGAQYVVPVFEHHDGIAMYDSSLSDWTAAKMGQSAIWPAGVITYKHVDMQKDSGGAGYRARPAIGNSSLVLADGHFRQQ